MADAQREHEEEAERDPHSAACHTLSGRVRVLERAQDLLLQSAAALLPMDERAIP
jgi:hypothetical protein